MAFSKKKKSPQEEKVDKYIKGLKVLARMSPEQYWEWRTTIEEMDNAKNKQMIAELLFTNKQLEIDVLQAGLQQFRRDIADKAGIVKQRESDYDKIKADLGKNLGIDMENTLVDPYTYDVKQLPDDMREEPKGE